MRIIKGKIISVTDGEYQKVLTAIGVPNEEITNRSYFQHVGFSSIPRANSVGIGIMYDNQITFFASAEPLTDRPTLNNPGDTCIHSDENIYIKINANGDIGIVNENNSITINANGSINIGGSNLDALVKDAVLPTLRDHEHPISGGVAIKSTDAAMLVLDTAAGNKTQNVQAD